MDTKVTTGTGTTTVDRVQSNQEHVFSQRPKDIVTVQNLVLLIVFKIFCSILILHVPNHFFMTFVSNLYLYPWLTDKELFTYLLSDIFWTMLQKFKGCDRVLAPLALLNLI